MSILIKGMEMPNPGQIVLVEIDETGDVFAAYDGGRTKLAQYKAVPVHTPHGDLIDRDELKNKHHWTDDFYETEYVEVEDIDAAPTIIPASE